MDFTFNDEQQQFADALRRYLDKSYGFEARQAIVQSESGVSDEHWTAFTELGLTALPVPEAQGGFNGSPIDMLVVMQELGRALVIEPYWATAVGVEALRIAGTGEGEDASLLERAAQGEIKLAVAFHEPRARYDLFEVETVANGQGDQQTLTGTKSVVLHGAQADYWIVPARLNGEIALFVVARDAAGVKVTDYRTIDGQRAATLKFDGTPARQLTGKHAGAAALEHIADYGTVLLCAEAVGALDALNHATAEYTKTRQQFGQPIARFQALQHRMVEMLIHAEQARSITYLAAMRYTSADADERRRAVSAAKARVGQAARFVGQQAVQLHGGMGVTNEVAAAHLFKRLAIIETTLGDVDHHLARFAALPGFVAAEA
ncbi:L-prolyl-[peptidyl-carrier protein] dehydrogenase [Paraburkholderia domus]|uniref:L-prolyl-[peptidyl-carrier protein] dehydrogenase n=1 Tax=Paraburkholderia domus TaxID=2793075 RepID=A0A9N8MXX2_9BURK|nr:acyl-CoA dehydrogenase [Paraburkholderia domus]MBK5059996.1 acyl-CoA dehydrogenase family protein [Burkholderia sp. R-70199]MBK5087411.1 acyl-CoA dehydrogenase family protein [Burkholderia sp. R-69927]MBK5121563.1 acyl-CoA dehydrogenase family protein [Burkholderia sp. R-69980]MBK5167460.1 acyl-CoA dehydrogenase family protein [Burkholderia sp. R-70211]MBK5181160.1 acyl-CoA dehydrogenase family protein [Burkholderia sp. R-69749]MCI0146020.1 acyl-CoA dehydrogenase family protein [Paraburkho